MISGTAVADHVDDTAEPNARGSRPHAPIGVMGDHMHDKGEWMLSYRYMRMDMGGNRVGGSSITLAQTLDQFMVSPTRMDMDMHMFGLMYAPSNTVTLMVMAPYIRKSMDHVTRMGGMFTTTSKGVGDVKINALVSLWRRGNHRLHLNAGLSAPTGSIAKRDATPMSPSAQLPYPMQIGSGTWDLLPGTTYTGFTDRWQWGAQVRAIIRTGDNSRGYTLGDRLLVTTWAMVRLARGVETGLRLTYEHWGNIDGADAVLNPMMVQTANPGLQGGDQVSLGVSANFEFQKGCAERSPAGG